MIKEPEGLVNAEFRLFRIPNKENWAHLNNFILAKKEKLLLFVVLFDYLLFNSKFKFHHKAGWKIHNSEDAVGPKSF